MENRSISSCHKKKKKKEGRKIKEKKYFFFAFRYFFFGLIMNTTNVQSYLSINRLELFHDATAIIVAVVAAVSLTFIRFMSIR